MFWDWLARLCGFIPTESQQSSVLNNVINLPLKQSTVLEKPEPDIEIISSDDTVFPTHSKLLMAHRYLRHPVYCMIR